MQPSLHLPILNVAWLDWLNSTSWYPTKLNINPKKWKKWIRCWKLEYISLQHDSIMFTSTSLRESIFVPLKWKSIPRFLNEEEVKSPSSNFNYLFPTIVPKPKFCSPGETSSQSHVEGTSKFVSPNGFRQLQRRCCLDLEPLQLHQYRKSKHPLSSLRVDLVPSQPCLTKCAQTNLRNRVVLSYSS